MCPCRAGATYITQSTGTRKRTAHCNATSSLCHFRLSIRHTCRESPALCHCAMDNRGSPRYLQWVAGVADG